MGYLSERQRSRFASALARLGDDDELFVSLAKIAAEDGPLLMEQLKSDIASGDLRSVATTGHALKGLLSTYETGSPIAELQQLIDAAREGDRIEAEAATRRQLPLLRDFINELQKLGGCATQ